MEKTAVEWLEKAIALYVERCSLQKEFEQAKEMERQQIIEAYDEADGKIIGRGEQYYNETFKNK